MHNEMSMMTVHANTGFKQLNYNPNDTRIFGGFGFRPWGFGGFGFGSPFFGFPFFI